eukprot:TRINITY_DN6956_c0_g1_i1.p1 TRINITY_DN6956_c0_g1~~TRINITY_DN6956_c0_g1_i1.p1  ORF type:complete len:241 (+),score=23.17 TRINITY_DN6956_c0_g1_i1:117-839(+)
MQRGLVGSEMCIRDSINAEYMGRSVKLMKHIPLMKIVNLCRFDVETTMEHEPQQQMKTNSNRPQKESKRKGTAKSKEYLPLLKSKPSSPRNNSRNFARTLYSVYESFLPVEGVIFEESGKQPKQNTIHPSDEIAKMSKTQYKSWMNEVSLRNSTTLPALFTGTTPSAKMNQPKGKQDHLSRHNFTDTLQHTFTKTQQFSDLSQLVTDKPAYGYRLQKKTSVLCSTKIQKNVCYQTVIQQQ